MLNMIMVTSQLVDLEHTVAFHKPILAAIEARDAGLASRLMTAHLTDATELLSQSREQEFARALRAEMASSSPGLRTKKAAGSKAAAALVRKSASGVAVRRKR